jgi:hypothetical protein
MIKRMMSSTPPRASSRATSAGPHPQRGQSAEERAAGEASSGEQRRLVEQLASHQRLRDRRS